MINSFHLREGTFFLGAGGGLGPQREGLSPKVSTKWGRAILLCELFKGRVTHFFQNFFNEDFCLLLSIFL